jgi:uncharacterized protein YcnI
MSSRLARRAAAITAASAAVLLGVAGPALAHVTVNPGTAVQGSYTKVSFRVPNEQAAADTNKIVVNLPADHPLASVSVKPTSGWTIQITKTKLATPIKSDDGEVTQAITQITWSGGKIEPGQFQEFDVSMGPLPTDTDQLMFKADQTYSNGQVVNWNEEMKEGAAEPEHPAPTLTLTKAGAAPAAAAADSSKMGVAPVPTAASATSDSDGTARTLGGLGLGAGAIGLVLGGLGLARSRKSSPDQPAEEAAHPTAV